MYDSAFFHKSFSSKERPIRFAEECAVTAETEIRTKEPAINPNSYVDDIKQQKTYGEERAEVYQVERSTMRTKANSIKSDETIPVMTKRSGKDVMADGTNLRGKRALRMFERNFKRSRLGNAVADGQYDKKTNVQVIAEKNEKKKKENKNERRDG